VKRAAFLLVPFALAACTHEGKNLSGLEKTDPPGAQHEAPPTSNEPANPHEPQANPHAATNPHAGATPPAPAAASEGPVAWSVPEGWKGGASTRPMRVAEFDVGADESGAAVQCVVYGGIGGDDEQNLSRWISQMGDGAKSSAKTTHADHDGLTITRLEAHGSYTDSMRPGEPKSVGEATMLAAIVDGPSGKLHVKLVGPSQVVDANAAKFDAFLASMRTK